MHRTIDYKGDRFDPVFKLRVLAFRLDDLVKHFRIPTPNQLKIDVDGIEIKVLKGAERTLCQPSVKSVILELEGGDRG
jgi:FkbM family methyltransferase